MWIRKENAELFTQVMFTPNYSPTMKNIEISPALDETSQVNYALLWDELCTRRCSGDLFRNVFIRHPREAANGVKKSAVFANHCRRDCNNDGGQQMMESGEEPLQEPSAARLCRHSNVRIRRILLP